MSLKTLFLFALLFAFSGISFSETEPFDRIVLKDMTVIKASLVKEVGDSLAYFELNDPDFVKHMVARDQVFKWVRAASQPAVSQPQKAAMPKPDTAHVKPPAPPPPPSPPPPQPPEPPRPAMIKDTFPDNIPVADYQVISARLDSIEKSKIRQMTGIEDSTPAVPVTAPVAAPVAIAKINAAVYGLVGKGLGKSSAGINASAQMRTELVNTGVFRIMERAEMEKILNEKGFKKACACDDPACLAQVGQLLGVDRILSGSVVNEGKVWTFSLLMINAGTGEVLFTVTENYEGWINKDIVPGVTARLARQMADRVTNKPAVKINTETGVLGAAPAVAEAEYDTSDVIPEGLTKVRLDPPTGTEGIKIVPRSGMVAININPSFTSLGLGFRSWSAGGFGFAAGGAVLWGSASGFTVKGQLMLALNANSKSRVRWYLFPMIGYQWITYEIEGMDYGSISTPASSFDLSLMNFAIGLGAEWRVGINRNHGLAVEVGYQGGSADYTMHTDAHTYGSGMFSYTVPASDTKGTYEPMPFYFMFSYAYYF